MDGPVAVIGGGWAGCAAAVELARHGHRVELYESAPVLGGRARRVIRDGLALDNGQHLLLGAYRETLALAAALRTDGDGPAWATSALAMGPLARGQHNALALTARALPAPFGLALGLLGASGLSVTERLATLRWFARLRRADFRVAPGATVSAMLAGVPRRARERLWEPLCLAALNTPPGRASAQVFANVLQAAFDADADAARLVLPRIDLGDAFPDPAARWLRARGHAVHTATPARVLAIGTDGVDIDVRGRRLRRRAAIVAVGPHQLHTAFDRALAQENPEIAAALGATGRLTYEPITTLYLGYAAEHRLPRGLVRLDDAPGQWIFDRSDILARAAAQRRCRPGGACAQPLRGGDQRERSAGRPRSPRAGSGSRRPAAPIEPRIAVAELVAGHRRKARHLRLRAGPAATALRAPRRARASRGRLHVRGIPGDPRGRGAQRQGRRSGAGRRSQARLRSRRCCSRFHSRSLSVARLSCCFLPLASPIVSLTRPFL